LYLIHRREILSGSALQIGVDLNDSQTAAETVKSKVLRCDKLNDHIFGIGVKFIDISEQMKYAIANHVQDNISNQPSDDVKQYLSNNHSWDISRK